MAQLEEPVKSNHLHQDITVHDKQEWAGAAHVTQEGGAHKAPKRRQRNRQVEQEHRKLQDNVSFWEIFWLTLLQAQKGRSPVAT